MTAPMTLRDGSETYDRRLDRLVEFDERSRAFPVERRLTTTELRSKAWQLPRAVLMDQQREGACVSTGIGHEIAASPVGTHKLTFPLVREHIYWPAQRIDPWAGGDYPGATPRYHGTSVLSGLKVARDLGFYEGFDWSFDIDTFLAALCNEGPAVIGIWWSSSMFYPRPSGLLEVSGDDAGGHCVAVTQLRLKPRLRGEPNLKEPVVAIAQSWGLKHGDRGFIYMRVGDLEARLRHDGEAAFPRGRKRPTGWPPRPA